MIGLSNRDLKALSTLTTRSQHLVNRDSMNMPELDLTNMHGFVSQLILRATSARTSDTRCAGLTAFAVEDGVEPPWIQPEGKAAVLHSYHRPPEEQEHSL